MSAIINTSSAKTDKTFISSLINLRNQLRENKISAEEFSLSWDKVVNEKDLQVA